MSAADLNLSTVELTSTLITAPLNGAPSSADYNDSQRSNLVDLSTIVSFINNQILPLINALPAGALLPSTAPVGIQGSTIWTNTSDQGQLFFDSLSSTPLTIYESFNILNGILTTSSQQLIDLGVEVASLQSLLASTNQNEISLALQNLSSSLSQLTVTQSVSNTAISSLQTEINTINVTLATKITNPMTTTGDIIYSSSGSTPARLGIGTSGYVLTVVGGVPAWAPATGGGGGGGGSYATTIGDGTSTVFTVTHNLGTEDVIVEIHNISSGEMEIVDVDIINTNQVTITYGSAPTLNGERVVVLSSGGSSTGLTSIGLSTNASWLTVGSSPLSSNGTITLDVTTGLTSNQFLATPSGSTGPVGLRAIAANDLPPVSVNTQSVSHTAVIGDANQLVVITDSSAANFTIPPNSSVAFPVGTSLSVIQDGTGQVTLNPQDGTVTINTPTGTLTTRARWSTISVVQISANVWVAGGDLT